MTTRHVPGYMPRQSADGQAHLAYFVDGISFVWSGAYDQPVEVCPGGYGEPVEYTFLTNANATPYAFRTACNAWLASQH